MLRNLAIAFVSIAALVAGLVVYVRRTTPETSVPHHTQGALAADNGEAQERVPSSDRALASLQQIAEASQRLMPEGFEGVFVTMRLEDLRRVRPRVQRDTSSAARRDDGKEVWAEDEPNGAHVIYLVGARTHLLEQVQFLSRLGAAEELGAHLQAMQARYGPPTGIWDCPETSEAPPLRRFTWRREGSSLMEAVLIYQSTIGLTLVVAPTDDVGRALARSQCRPVQSREQIGHFPVARELRGEVTPLVREVPREPSRLRDR